VPIRYHEAATTFEADPVIDVEDDSIEVVDLHGTSLCKDSINTFASE